MTQHHQPRPDRPAPRIERATGRHPHDHHQTEGDLMTSTTPSAGGILAAASALQGPQQTFTREQVAYLMHLAYESGRTATYLDDVAELHATWARNRDPRPTAEQRYAQRMAEMDAHAQARAAREGRPYAPYRGGPVDFETGRPLGQGEQVAA